MGNGYGALLAFKRDGTLIGPFNDDSRIVDPRGLAVDQKEGLLFLNSGGDRVLALGANGTIVRDTGPIARLNPGGGNFGPDGRYYVGLRSARTVMAFPDLLESHGRRLPSRNAERLEAFREKTSLQEARELCRIMSGHHVEVGFRCM